MGSFLSGLAWSCSRTWMASLALWRHLLMAPSSRYFKPAHEASSTPCRAARTQKQNYSNDPKRTHGLIRRQQRCLVSCSAASRWSSWPEPSTDTGSRSLTGCTDLWSDRCSSASRPGETFKHAWDLRHIQKQYPKAYSPSSWRTVQFDSFCVWKVGEHPWTQTRPPVGHPWLPGRLHQQRIDD